MALTAKNKIGSVDGSIVQPVNLFMLGKCLTFLLFLGFLGMEEKTNTWYVYFLSKK